MDQNTLQCPYGSNCPQVISNQGEIKSMSDRMDLQQKYIVEKIETIGSDVKEIKEFLNKDLDKYVDARINVALDKMQAKMFRWCLGALLGSGGLSALIALLVK